MRQENITDKIVQYIDSKTKTNDDKLEVKPDEFRPSIGSKEKYKKQTKEIINNDVNAALSNELKIICDNLLLKFFDLDDEKFFACLEKTIEWGFDICFREFIIDYYIRLIKDNKLRQYIILHLDSLLLALKDRLEQNLLNSIKYFNFTNTYDDHKINLIKNEIQGKELGLAAVKVNNFDEYEPPSNEDKEKLTADEKRKLRMSIINRLRYENPSLMN